MKKIITAGLVATSLAFAGAAFAQDKPAFSADTPFETIAANPDAKAIMDKDIGADVTKHPQYEMFKSMSPRQAAPNSGGALTDAMVDKLDTDLKTVKPK